MVALGDGEELGSAVSVSALGLAVLSAATRARVVDSGALLEAALMTATLATEPAMRTPPAATTVAMMLDRCMLFSLNRKLACESVLVCCNHDATFGVPRCEPVGG
jgi:hypothetical protein